jgi:hypothetical protein
MPWIFSEKIYLQKAGGESRLLVIGISVAIGKEQGLEWWKRIRTGVMECWA